MSKILEFIRNDHVQTTTVSGSCIIILALAFKYVLHQESTFWNQLFPAWSLSHMKP